MKFRQLQMAIRGCIFSSGSEIFLLIQFLLISFGIGSGNAQTKRPNVVIILADDLGFDDVSFRGSNHFLTPNIDALAYNGILLNNMYTPSMCTPSRAALLTGKYPIHTGMQHYVIANDQPWGLPLNETTMAQIFQKNDYRTLLVGKWHLGFSRQSYTPTLRGFDEHFGYLGAYVDYYDHKLYEASKPYASGHDFRENFTITHKYTNRYMTNVLTDAALGYIHQHKNQEKPLFMLLSHLAPHSGNENEPLQAPPEKIDQFSYITDKNQRIYAAMVSKLDDSVGEIIKALAEEQMLENTIIVFLSDNGGPTLGMHATGAQNYPLRGQKNSPWEGGIRSSAAIWSTNLKRPGSVWRQKMYMTDLLPTLATAVGLSKDALPAGIDGLDMWPAIIGENRDPIERDIVHNIDEIFHYTSYLNGKWKYVNGSTGKSAYDLWLGQRVTAEVDPRSVSYTEIIRNTNVWQSLAQFNPNSTTIDVLQLRQDAIVRCQFDSQSVEQAIACDPHVEPCLFDIDIDPCEQNNLYSQYKDTQLYATMLERIRTYTLGTHTPNNKPTDPNCDPRLHNNEWTWWEDEPEKGDGNSKALDISMYISFLIFSLMM